jgi:hypothetical protein
MAYCLVCNSTFTYGPHHGAEPQPCKCGQAYDPEPHLVTIDELDMRREVYAAEQANQPVCQEFYDDECFTPLDQVTDYNANTPLPEQHFLCQNCYDHKAESAQEASDADYYGGSSPTFAERVQMVKPR